MINCRTCKHYYTTEYYQGGTGWCELQLPPWLYKVLELDPNEVETKVSSEDTCSFAEEEK